MSPRFLLCKLLSDLQGRQLTHTAGFDFALEHNKQKLHLRIVLTLPSLLQSKPSWPRQIVFQQCANK